MDEYGPWVLLRENRHLMMERVKKIFFDNLAKHAGIDDVQLDLEINATITMLLWRLISAKKYGCIAKVLFEREKANMGLSLEQWVPLCYIRQRER